MIAIGSCTSGSRAPGRSTNTKFQSVFLVPVAASRFLRGRIPSRDGPKLFRQPPSSYESSVTSNPFDADLRRTSLDVFLRIFRPGDRILEIGAGPGLETLVLASRGIEVVATDISAQMIRRLKAKIELEGLRELVMA